MASQAEPPLKLLDAVRTLLRALYPVGALNPERVEWFADELRGWNWLDNSMWQDRLGPWGYDRAHLACDVLTKNVRELNIPLVGSHDGGMPDLISPIDCAEGKLSLPEATLRVELPRDNNRKIRWKEYYQVHCVADAVHRVAEELAPAGDRHKKTCSYGEYKQHWNDALDATKVWPSDLDDDVWAKQRGFSVESVRQRRRELIDGLPSEQRDHVRKGGPRRPFPNT